jgi:hypothetical protein
MRSAVFALVLATACTQSGAVRIVIDAPSDPTLTPIDDRLAQLMLRIDADGMPERVETRAVIDRGASIDLGDVPVAPGVRIALGAENAAGVMLGFGQSAGPVDVKLGPTVDVPIRMRRPFAYVSGGAQLATFDPTLERTQPYAGGIALAGAPLASAPTPDGADVVVILPGQLVMVSTATHQPEAWPAVPITGGATDVAISADSHYAIVAHDSGVTVVDLTTVPGGAAAPVFLAIGAVGAVSTAGDTGYALLATAPDDSCGDPPSTVQAIDLPSATMSTAVPVGAPARDLAADPIGGVVLAIPCRGAVSRLDATGETGALNDVLSVVAPTTVAESNGRLFAMGHTDASGGAHLSLVTSALDGSNAQTIDLPVPVERAESLDFAMPGQGADMRILADAVYAVDLAVLPDGARLAMIVAASFHGDQSGQVPLLGEPIIPAMDMSTWEVQLLDVSTAIPLLRMRTRCDLAWRHDSYLDAFACTQAEGQDQSASDWIPTHVSVLYGDR